MVYRASADAEALWWRLYGLWRMGESYMTTAALDAPGRPKKPLARDLGRLPRLLVWDAQEVLSTMHHMGREACIGALLARERLSGHADWRSVCKRQGVEWCREADAWCRGCEAHAWLAGVKEWLYYRLRDDAAEAPDLPWG